MLPEVKKFSGTGIAAFIIAIVVVLGFSLLLIYAFYPPASQYLEWFYIAGNLFFIFLGVLSIVGVVLGIIGLVKKTQNKIFTIIGLFLNFLFLVSSCVLWALSDVKLM
jgi:phosphoglycerol transferase MdoB-like AlkP superfamily enzyme